MTQKTIGIAMLLILVAGLVGALYAVGGWVPLMVIGGTLAVTVYITIMIVFLQSE